MEAADIVRLIQGVWVHPNAKSDYARRVFRIVLRGERKHFRARGVDGWLLAREIAKGPDEAAVVEDLVDVIHVGRTGESELYIGMIFESNANAVPGIAPVASVASGGPAGYVAWSTHDRVERATCSGEIDCLPTGVVYAGLRPEWLIRGWIDG